MQDPAPGLGGRLVVVRIQSEEFEELPGPDVTLTHQVPLPHARPGGPLGIGQLLVRLFHCQPGQLLLGDVLVGDDGTSLRRLQGERLHPEPALFGGAVAGVLGLERGTVAGQHVREPLADIDRVTGASLAGAIQHLQVVHLLHTADGLPDAVGAGEPSPGLIHGEDVPLAVQDRHVGLQRVEHLVEEVLGRLDGRLGALAVADVARLGKGSPASPESDDGDRDLGGKFGAILPAVDGFEGDRRLAHERLEAAPVFLGGDDGIDVRERHLEQLVP